jgi:prevent-host-death family protein
MTKTVSSAEFQKAFGLYREAALKEPVTITNHGRDSLVLMAADEYRRLKSLDRESLYVTELSDDDLKTIMEAEIPAEAVRFDDELTR